MQCRMMRPGTVGHSYPIQPDLSDTQQMCAFLKQVSADTRALLARPAADVCTTAKLFSYTCDLQHKVASCTAALAGFDKQSHHHTRSSASLATSLFTRSPLAAHATLSKACLSYAFQSCTNAISRDAHAAGLAKGRITTWQLPPAVCATCLPTPRS